MFRRFIAKIYHSLPLIRELDLIAQRLARVEQAQAVSTSVQARQLLEWLRTTDPRYTEPKRLLRHSFSVCSQGGEDGIVQEIFRRVGHTNRNFCEFGVGDGSENNTSFLLSQGWTGFWIDANPRFKNRLSSAGLDGDSRIRHAVKKINRENIVEILTELGVPRELDFLSVDIDQNTWHVWESLLKEFRPRVVAIEYNAAIPPDVEWKVTYDAERVWDGTHNYGASLKAFEKLGEQMGYKLVGCDPLGTDAFFVREELVKDLFAAPFTAENHYEPPRFHLIHRMGMPSSLLDAPPAR
jgi:hypothetical protein